MNDANERLRAAREKAGFKNASDAASAKGWTYSTYAGHENGSRQILPDAANKYARAFGVSANYILFGTGSEITSVESDDTIHTNGTFIPVYDVQASAGFGALVDYEEQTHSLAFPPDYLRKLTGASPKHLVIISTKGDSMEPTLLDDDIVLVDTSKTHMGYEGMFVLRHNDTLLVKRAGMAPKPGHVTLISDNKAYPPVEARLEDLHVVGKVLWYGRKV
jgi:phage repressor protein C with HTH and peptisase S24 domain